MLSGIGKSFAARSWMWVALFALMMSLASCGKMEKAAEKTAGAKPPQQNFATPADAGSAVFDAAKSGDQAALLAIFGPDGKDIFFTGDAVKDRDNLQAFVAAYSQMHRWGKIKAGGQVLYVGTSNHPFPIPLDQDATGHWSFDTAAGKDEVLARRIGDGELVAIAVSNDIAAAQRQYFSQPHEGAKQYAQKFLSDEGQQNGLYWPVEEDKPASPLGPLADFAKAMGYSASDKPQPFNGYYYRILTRQGDTAAGGGRDYLVNGKLTGGFAILAWPAEYRNSGIMTFVTGKDGVVYQKDLGEKTAELAKSMQEYNPGDGWTAAAGSEVVPPPPGTKSAKK